MQNGFKGEQYENVLVLGCPFEHIKKRLQLTSELETLER